MMSLSLLSLLLLLTASTCSVWGWNSNYGQTSAVFTGGADGLFDPINVAVDSSNNLFVTDLLFSSNYYNQNGRLVKYSSAGVDLTGDLNADLLNTFSVGQDVYYVYYSATSLLFIGLDGDDNLYTNNGSTIVKLSENAQSVLQIFPSIYSDIGGFTVDKQTGRIFVFSPTDAMVYVQNSDGTLLSNYSTETLGDGQYSVELGQLTVIGSTGLLLAVDTYNNVALWLTLDGTVVYQYTATAVMTAGAVDANNNALLAIADYDPSESGAAINWRIVSFASPDYSSMITYPISQIYAVFVSMAIGSDGNVYLLDARLDRVTIFTPSTGKLTGQLRDGWTPREFATDNAGNLYICDQNTGDLLLLNSDGSLNRWISITSFSDGNSYCAAAHVNSIGTVLATTDGSGFTTVNGSLDGQNVYLFNVSSGQLMSIIPMCTDCFYGVDALDVDNQENVYYLLNADTTVIHVVNSSGGFVNDIFVRQDPNFYFYNFMIDASQKLNLFYAFDDNSQIMWDQLTLDGAITLQTNMVTNINNNTYSEYINGERVDYLGYLYYMVRIYGQQGAGAGREAQIRVFTPNGTVLPFWTDQVVLDDLYTLSIDGMGNVYNNDPTEHKVTKRVGLNYVSPPSLSSSSLCILLYSLPGNVDYPWSSAILVQFSYDPSMILQTAAGPAIVISGGNGTRVFTNRFGVSFTTPLTIATAGTGGSNNWLYLNATSPVDANGITWIFSSPVQLPGHGPSVLYNRTTLYNQSGVVVESMVSRIDSQGSSFLSSITGFTNKIIGASNINSLSVTSGVCQAPITFSNGLRAPTQSSAANGSPSFSYSYFISDGLNYSVQGNLTITCASAFATNRDQLGNPTQIVTNVIGTRTYTFLPTGAKVISTVNGLSTAGYPYADQRFYPYSLLASAPGVYSMNTAPFFDYDGVEFFLSPSIPVNGLPPGIGKQYNTSSLYFTTTELTDVLTEGYYINAPLIQYQQQIYIPLRQGPGVVEGDMGALQYWMENVRRVISAIDVR